MRPRLVLTPEVLDREFPSRRHSVQLNHAAVCPLPARAVAALQEYATSLSTRGSLDYLQWNLRTSELRRLAAELIGAGDAVGGASSISVVPSTTWGLDLVASGIDWKDGDNVVTTTSEFPANLVPWLSLARRGVSLTRVPTRDGAFTTEELAAHLSPRTRLVCLSAVAFHTGFAIPIEEIGALCRQRGVLFGLDAIQALGAVPVDVTAGNVDFLAADGHKWLLGPEGCGILFTTPELRARLTPPPGWLNLRSAFEEIKIGQAPQFWEDGRKLEPGALSTPGIYALTASIGLLLEIGLPEIQSRIGQTLDVLVAGLPAKGFSPVLFEGASRRSGILAARPPQGTSPWALAKRLFAQGISVSAREGFLRFSPHVGNDPAEAQRVLDAL